MITQKHFIKIAEIIELQIRTCRANNHPTGELNGLTRSLAYYFSNQNPKFRRDLFLKACGVHDLGVEV